MATNAWLRPDGDYWITEFFRDQNGQNYGGGAGGYGNTRDNNDGTYVYPLLPNPQNLEMNYTTYTLPVDVRCAGARLVSRIRSFWDDQNFNLDAWLRPPTGGDGGGQLWTGPYNTWDYRYNPWLVREFTQADIDGIRGCYRGNGNPPGTESTSRISESYIELDIRYRPYVTIQTPAWAAKVFPRRPTITWTYDARGDTVRAHQMKVFTYATVTGGGFNADTSPTVWDSGRVDGAATSKQVGLDLTYGASYYAYVRLANDFLGADWWSPWTWVYFTVNTPPTVTSVATSPATPITTTNQPNITGTYNDVDADRATALWIRVYSEAQYSATGFNPDDPAAWPPTWSSGQLSVDIANGGTFSHQVGVALTPNTNFKAYVWANEEGTALTRWSVAGVSGVFVIQTAPGVTYDPPAAPEVTGITTDQTNQRNIVAVQGRDNLLTRNLASADTGVLGWENIGNGTLTRDTTTFLQGGASLKQTTTWTTGVAIDMTARSGPGGAAALPVTPGRTYTGMAYSRPAASPSLSTRVDIRWYDSTGATISTSQGTAQVGAVGSWALRTVTAVAPANAAFAALLLVTLATSTVGKAFLWDNMSLAPGTLTSWSRGGLTFDAGNLSDAFNRADSATSLGTADIGGAWAAAAGTWGISGNRAYLVSVTADAQAVLTSSYLADGYVEADITLSPGRALAGLVFHHLDANNTMMVQMVRFGTTDTLALYKRVAGTWTALATVTAAGFILGTTYKLRVEFYGGQVYVYVDGQQRIAYLMLAGELNQFGGGGAEKTYGKYGIYVSASATWDDNATRFDNFKAGLVATQRVTLQRSLDGGTTWANVRNGVDMNLGPSQLGSVYDYEVPAGVLARYRAVTEGSEARTTVTSAYSPTLAQTTALTITTWWLKDAVDPALNMTLKVAPPFDFTRKEPQATFDPMGRRQSVFVSDGAKGIEGELNLWVPDRTTYDKLVAILGNGRALLLQDPLGRSWWVKFGPQDWSLLRALPQTSETTPIRHAHQVTLPFVEVAAPAVV